MILMIDNYDSFTYNLVQYLGELGEQVEVFRNDEITLDEIRSLVPDLIVISPGPCTPNEAGISMNVVEAFFEQIPLLGICLGHQSIGQVMGGDVVRAREVMHGKTSEIHHNGTGVFSGLPSPFTATRYHTNKFNVSTASAFVAAAAGARVAKHGNRGASSKSGSADVLEAAGASIMLGPDEVARCIETTGVGFLFALNHHSAMRHAIGPRREMTVRTVFNLLGPLTNPAGARRQLLGVYARKWVRPIAEVLQKLGSEHVLVVHSEDGLDEISISAATHVAELRDEEIQEYDIDPEDFGLRKSPLEELIIENSTESLALVKKALLGIHEGASNIVVLNAGAAIYTAGQCHDLTSGVEMAQDAIGSGLADEKMKDFAAFTSQIKETS